MTISVVSEVVPKKPFLKVVTEVVHAISAGKDPLWCFWLFSREKGQTDHLTTFEATTLVFCVFFVGPCKFVACKLFSYRPQVQSLRLIIWLQVEPRVSPLTDRDLNFFGYKPKAQLWDLDFWLQLEPRVLWDLNFFSTVTNLTQCF